MKQSSTSDVWLSEKQRVAPADPEKLRVVEPKGVDQPASMQQQEAASARQEDRRTPDNWDLGRNN